MEISTHQECNVNLSLTKEISALFHNLQSLKKKICKAMIHIVSFNKFENILSK